ncbi:MAG: hypothetical protein ABI638_14585 [Ignavibacteriota bacterium]
MSSLQTAFKSISDLVKDFKANEKFYLSSNYSEVTEEEIKIVEESRFNEERDQY